MLNILCKCTFLGCFLSKKFDMRNKNPPLQLLLSIFYRYGILDSMALDLKVRFFFWPKYINVVVSK